MKPISLAMGPARVGGRGQWSLGQVSFFEHRLVFLGGAARPQLVSNVSVFSRQRTFRSPQVFESNENWGFGRDCWVSAGLVVRALLALGSEHFNGVLGSATDPRFELRSTFPVRSVFVFR